MHRSLLFSTLTLITLVFMSGVVTLWANYVKYGILLCPGCLWAGRFVCCLLWIHPVRCDDDLWHGFFVCCIYCVREGKRPTVTACLLQPLRSGFPPWLIRVRAEMVGWVCRISSVQLQLWSQKATMKFDLACGSLFQIWIWILYSRCSKKRRRENNNSITGTIWGTFRNGQLHCGVLCLP
jgi:hypothetical protein